MALIRLQKILADAGIASRRGSEELISAGRVKLGLSSAGLAVAGAIAYSWLVVKP